MSESDILKNLLSYIVNGILVRSSIVGRTITLRTVKECMTVTLSHVLPEEEYYYRRDVFYCDKSTPQFKSVFQRLKEVAELNGGSYYGVGSSVFFVVPVDGIKYVFVTKIGFRSGAEFNEHLDAVKVKEKRDFSYYIKLITRSL